MASRKACLTQNTQLIRLAIRVNRTYTERTVALSELHSGHSSVFVKAVYDLKKKKLTRVPCPCIIVLAIVQDRVKPY